MTRRRFPADEWPRLVSDRRRSLAEPEDFVAAFEWPEGARVADLGCGPGFFTPALLEVTTGPLLAIDAQPEMLAILGERLGPSLPRVQRIAAELDRLPIASGSVDVGWCAFVLHEVVDLAGVAGELRRVLAPGGRLYALEWEPVQTDHGPPVSERIGAPEVARALAGTGFAVEGPRAVTDSQYALTAR